MSFPLDLSPFLIAKAARLSVNSADITEQFIAGGGKGGQKINKTSSCVLLKHVPTGIMVRCQKHREQSKNRLSAYKLLILKVEAQVMGEESTIAKKIFKIRKQKQKRSKRAKEKMLKDKAMRSEVKVLRAPVKGVD